MRIRDWSADVCSSDLVGAFAPAPARGLHRPQQIAGGKIGRVGAAAELVDDGPAAMRIERQMDHAAQRRLGRAAERRVGQEDVSKCRSRWSPYHSKNKISSTQAATQETIKPLQM